MGLTNIVSTLLPHDYREQVLGDLQERGLRFRDIVSVLPRVWGSYVLRSVTGPVLHLASASETAIRSRTEQLHRQGRLAIAYSLAIIIAVRVLRDLPGPLATRIAISLFVFTLAAVLGRFLGRSLETTVSLIPSRANLLADYRAQLRLQISTSLVPFSTSILFLVTPDRYRTPFYLVASQSGAWATVAVTGTLLAWSCLRIRRLRRELATLQTAQ